MGARRSGKHIAGYGTPRSGKTLLNYRGIDTGFLEYTVDPDPTKQGRYVPGSQAWGGRCVIPIPEVHLAA